MRSWYRVFITALIFSAGLSAQRRVDARNSFHRVIAVVPRVGSGTPADPVRPKYVPVGQPDGPSSPGIIAFATAPTDDGKLSIVELVAVDRAALAEVLADHEPGVLVFEKGRVRREDIESAIRPFRKDFSLDHFGVAVQ